MGKRNDIYRFFLVKPNMSKDPKRMMQRLMKLKQVEEVHMTDGEFGFIIKARADYSNGDETRAQIRGLNSRFCEAVSYYNLSKRR